MNERIAIRALLKTRIIAAATVAGARVSTNRTVPLMSEPSTHGGGDELPACLIYTRSESSEIFDESPRRYRRTSTVRVECVAANDYLSGVTLDDALDAFAGQVERALLTDPQLGGLVSDTTLTGSLTVIGEDDAARLYGATVLTFEVVYFTEDPEPGQPSLSDLERFYTQFNLDAAQAVADRAENLIEGLEA